MQGCQAPFPQNPPLQALIYDAPKRAIPVFCQQGEISVQLACSCLEIEMRQVVELNLGGGLYVVKKPISPSES